MSWVITNIFTVSWPTMWRQQYLIYLIHKIFVRTKWNTPCEKDIVLHQCHNWLLIVMKVIKLIIRILIFLIIYNRGCDQEGKGKKRLNLMTKLPRNFPCNMTFLGKHRKEGEIFNLLQISQQISMVTRKLIKR